MRIARPIQRLEDRPVMPAKAGIQRGSGNVAIVKRRA
jgi:hypothetical protein